MFPQVTEDRKKRIISFVCFMLIAINSLMWAEIALAQGSFFGKAFGTRTVGNVRGTRVNIWSANHPPNYWFIASMTGVCTTAVVPCSIDMGHGWFETGVIRGLASDNSPNQLQQFAAFRSTGLNPPPLVVFDIAYLNPNSWYTFQTLYSNTAQRWEAWRGNTPVYHFSNLNFTQGHLVFCGAEGEKNSFNQPPIPLGAECNNMRYKLTGSSAWVQYEYTNPQVIGPYCVFRPYQFGAFGWGPC